MAPKPKSPPPRAIVEREKGGRLTPVAPYDRVIVDQSRIGAQFELVPIKMTDHRMAQRKYWMVLGAVVEATGTWPTSNHLHEVLVRRAGFVTPALDPTTGEYVEIRDSTALDSMTTEAFAVYMQTALALLSESLGIDVLDLLPPEPAR